MRHTSRPIISTPCVRFLRHIDGDCESIVAGCALAAALRGAFMAFAVNGVCARPLKEHELLQIDFTLLTTGIFAGDISGNGLLRIYGRPLPWLFAVIAVRVLNDRDLQRFDAWKGLVAIRCRSKKRLIGRHGAIPIYCKDRVPSESPKRKSTLQNRRSKICLSS